MVSKPDDVSDVARTLELNESPGRGKRWIKWIIILFLLAAAAYTVLAWKKTDTSQQIKYKTQKVQTGDFTVVVTATGTLQPTNQVDVGSELSGIIKTVEVDYNDKVEVGQVLAALDTTKLKAQIMESKATLQSAKGNVAQAQATVKETRRKLKQLETVRKLSNNKVPSQSEMDEAEAALERALADEISAKASVSKARAALEADETDLSKSVIRSPINGVVLTRDVGPGQTVAASFTAPVLFVLAQDLKQMDLLANVDEADVGKVREGQTASFNVPAYPDRSFEAKITQVRYGASTTSGVVTYETLLFVNNPDLALRPGMTATADITVKKVENALLAPGAALRFAPPQQAQSRTSGSLLGALLPRPPRRGAGHKKNNGAADQKSRQRVYVLEGRELVPVFIRVGDTNGDRVEVLEGDLKSGMDLVVDTISEAK